MRLPHATTIITLLVALLSSHASAGIKTQTVEYERGGR